MRKQRASLEAEDIFEAESKSLTIKEKAIIRRIKGERD